MNIRVLVIDDDEDLLFVAQQLLTAQESSFHLTQVSTAQKALQLMDEEDFDAVICDFYLGIDEMNGLQILEWLRDRGSNTPFIIFTGRSREEVAIQALNLGADYYLEKGEDLESLFTEIGHYIRNVVKGRKTEHALYESEQRYRTLVKSMNDQIYVIDEKNRITQFHSPDKNPHLPHPQEIIGKLAHDVFPSGFLEPFHTLSLEVRAIGERKSFDFKLCIERMEKWLTVDLDLHEDQKSIIVIIRNITERKKAENEVKLAEREWRNTFDALPDLVSVLDNNFRIIQANKAMANVLEYSREELIGRPCYEVMHNSDGPFPRCPHLVTMETGKQATAEILDPNLGRPYLVTTSPIFEEEGNPVGVVHIAHDISERVKAEDIITTERDKAQAYLDIAEVILVALDVNGNVTLINRKGCEVLECSKEEALGQNWISAFLPERIQNHAREFFSNLIGGHLEETKYAKSLINTKSGKERIIYWVNSVLRNEKGEIIGTLSSGEDISEQIRLREKIQSNEDFLNSIIEASPIAVNAYDTEGVFIRANKACLDLFGVASERALKGHNIFSDPNLSEDDKQKMLAGETLRFEGSFNFDLFREKTGIETIKSGEEYIESVIAPLGKDDSGNPRGFIIQILEISERMKAERKLQESEAKFRQVIDSSPMGIHIYELDSEKSFILTEANQAANRILGINHDTLIGKSIQKAFSIFKITKVPSELWDIAEKGSQWEGEKISYKMDQISQALEMYAFQSSPGKVVVAFLDSKERKVAEQTLKISEENLRTLFDTIEDMLFIVGLDARVITTNKSARVRLGYTEEELQGIPAVHLHPIERRDEAAAILKEIMGGKTTYCPVPLITKDGTELQVETQITLGKWQGSDVLFGISRDVSRRLEIESALEKQVAFLNEVIESLDHPFYVIDANDYTIQMANQAARNGIEQLCGTCYSITHLKKEPCAGKDHPCPLSEVRRTKSRVVTEHIHFDSEGNPRDVEVHGHPVLNEYNEVVQMIEYSIDITERKNAIRALEASEHRFRDLFEKAPLGYQTLDIEGKIINVNQAWLDTIGYEKEDVVGHHISDFMTLESREKFKEKFPVFKTEGFVRDTEFEMVTSNRSILVARFNGRISYDEYRKFKQAHCIFQDVTDWKRADDLLRRQKEELSELAHVMSHDLGNKMKNIRSLVKIESRSPDEEILQRIDNIAQQSAELLQASAELADAGIIIERKEEVDLNIIVREIAKITIPETVRFHSDNLPIVLGSPERISQIFQNLLVNAVEHGNPTKIEILRAELSTGTSIIIRNDGAIIPFDIRPSIFRRGFTTKERGTGLGLSIVKKLVEAHGWRISLEPEDTTSFVITLDSIVESSR